MKKGETKQKRSTGKRKLPKWMMDERMERGNKRKERKGEDLVVGFEESKEVESDTIPLEIRIQKKIDAIKRSETAPPTQAPKEVEKKKETTTKIQIPDSPELSPDQ